MSGTDDRVREDSIGWTFLSNHGHVLVAMKESPDARLRELAARVGISERAIQLIVGDLERAGYVGSSVRGDATTTPSQRPAPAASGGAAVVRRRPAVDLRLSAS